MRSPRMATSFVLIGLLLPSTAPVLAGAQKPKPEYRATAPLSVETRKALQDGVTQELKVFGGKESVPGVVVGVWQPGKTPFVRAAHGYALDGNRDWEDSTVVLSPSLTGRRGNDFRHGRHENMGEGLRFRQHQQACNATGTLALCTDNHCGAEPWTGHRLHRRVIRIYGRHQRIQHRRLLPAEQRRDNHRLRHCSDREA
jgi:hypothetical protein